jgi:hypothetical protein
MSCSSLNPLLLIVCLHSTDSYFSRGSLPGEIAGHFFPRDELDFRASDHPRVAAVGLSWDISANILGRSGIR